MRLKLSYDTKNNEVDILYARFLVDEGSYGDEDEDGIVTFYGLESNTVTGIAIYDFNKRFKTGELNLKNFPIDVEQIKPYLEDLLYTPTVVITIPYEQTPKKDNYVK